ncbi:MAG: ChaN family lipoprotein [Leptothrix sp. (in: b-proteobacteria)]
MVMSLRGGLWTLLGCVLGACLTLGLSACSTPPPEPAAEQILDLASGQLISRDQLLASLRASDYVLLGEQHDNPHHHALRGALLADLQRPGAAVVAGNGHVHRDYGVPHLIAAWQPAAKVISIGFLESTDDLAASRQLYTHVWMTTAPHRDDPCARP